MFGFKLISEKQYNQMYENMNNNIDEIVDLQQKVARKEHDCKSLKESIKEKESKIARLNEDIHRLRQFKRDAMDMLVEVGITLCASKCSKCKHESEDCKKYSFGEHDFCLIPQTNEQ